jgi:hypothetical protein
MLKGRSVACAVVVAVFALGGSGCGGQASPTPTGPTPAQVTLRIVPASQLLARGGTARLKAVLDVSPGGPRDVTDDSEWSASDTKAVMVLGGGVFTAIRTGDVQVTARYGNALARAWLTIVPPVPLTSTDGSGATGRVTDVLAGMPIADATVRFGPVTITTGADGRFDAPVAGGGYIYDVFVSARGYVARTLGVRVPGPSADITMIPSTFDLTSFDEMLRGSDGVRRWERRPALVVVDRVLDFVEHTDLYPATDEQVPDADIQAIVRDTCEGLPLLTDAKFDSFAAVVRESPPPGTLVDLSSREGSIVVGRFKHLTEITGAGALGRHATRAWEVVAGVVFLDQDQDRSSNTNYVHHTRVHELGHALGWGHVSERGSIMNSWGAIQNGVYAQWFTPFDYDALHIAYRRPLGNLAPDDDPLHVSVNRVGAPRVWSPIQR